MRLRHLRTRTASSMPLPLWSSWCPRRMIDPEEGRLTLERHDESHTHTDTGDFLCSV